MSEETDPPASRGALGTQLARIWSNLLPGLVPEKPGMVQLLRLHGSWDQADALALLARLGVGGRRFAVTGGRRTRVRESVAPLAAVLELSTPALAEAIGHWGASDPSLGIEIATMPSEAAERLLRGDGAFPLLSGEGGQSIRTYMTTSRDRRSLFILSDQTAETVRHLLERSSPA